MTITSTARKGRKSPDAVLELLLRVPVGVILATIFLIVRYAKDAFFGVAGFRQAAVLPRQKEEAC